MSLQKHFELLANYNRWMNVKLYDASARLSAEEMLRDRGAYFKSILGTLNHIVVGDTIWLKRFAQHSAYQSILKPVVDVPDPMALDSLLFTDFNQLYDHRRWLDEKIIEWVAVLMDKDLDDLLSYRNTKGIPSRRQYSSLILHFFNHQTHHRGQVTTLLSQAGQDVGVTDLLSLIPNQD